MNTNQTLAIMDMQAKLSTLWIFVALNVLFRDIHEFFRPGLLAEITAGIVNGVQITDSVLLVAGISLQISLAMIPLSRFLAHRPNRWANVIAGIITIGFIITNGPKDLDDLFFAGVEITALALIIWLAWKWPESQP